MRRGNVSGIGRRYGGQKWRVMGEMVMGGSRVHGYMFGEGGSWFDCLTVFNKHGL